LGEKSLVAYSIEFALSQLKNGDELCISTDDNAVLDIAKNMGVKIPFIRPQELATDTASTYDVLIHAINHYKNIDKNFDALLLLQPTSPFRVRQDLMEMISIFNHELDMVVSVKKAKENPYFTLFEEESGFLKKSKLQNFERRQDAPDVFAFNGSMYLININSLLKMQINEFKKIKKLVMPEERSLDIDTLADWALAEFYLNKQ
jgi:N-acylneuraminate cytidylyltransferase